MHAWRKSGTFLSLLEHKQTRAKHDKKKSESHLDDIFIKISKCQRDYEEINLDMAQLIPLGVLSRSEIYQRIRQQGVLMSRQQDITQKIIDFHSDVEIEKQKIQQCQSKIIECEKRHRNIARNLQRMRRDELLRSDINTENDIEEMSIYGNKVK